MSTHKLDFTGIIRLQTRVLCICSEMFEQERSKVYIAFVGFRKTFDSVLYDKLLQAMQQKGVKGTFFASINSKYDSLLSRVKANNEYSDFSECRMGVRQGCVLNPIIFSLFIDQLAKYITGTGRHDIQLLSGLTKLFILSFFSDDVALLITTPCGLQNQLETLKVCCDRLKMEVTTDKTKFYLSEKAITHQSMKNGFMMALKWKQ